MRWLIRATVLFALIIGGFIGLERLIVYPLDPTVEDPARQDLPQMRARRFDTGETELMIWTSPAQPGRPTLLYFHGNAGNLADRAARFRILTRAGYGIVAPGYRGGSGSKGWPREAALRRDADWIYAQLVSGGLTGTPITPVIYGESMGTAVTIHLNASEVGQSNPPLAIVLEAPFTSLKDIARDLWPELQLLTGLMLSQWNSADLAPQLSAPLLVVHGDQDKLIPVAQGRAIFDAATATNKDFYTVSGAGHLDVWTVATQRRIKAFLDAL